MYVYGWNTFLANQTKKRSDKDIIRYFVELTAYFERRGINPGFHIMDNKASTEFKNSRTTIDIKYQLVTPSNHRAKNTDRSINIFKNHFLAGLLNVDAGSQLKLWDRLLQQETISLNLLCQSRLHPHLSAYAHIYRDFDNKHTLLYPQGTRLLMINRPKYRASWEPHGEFIWYIIPAMDHYRCHINFGQQ